MRRLISSIIWGVLACVPAACPAAGQGVYTVAIKGHKFVPVELNIPANRKIKLVVDNQDPTPEEFESYELNREKVVSGGKQIIVYLGPLKPGPYKYFGDFHPQTAQGTVVAQ